MNSEALTRASMAATRQRAAAPSLSFEALPWVADAACQFTDPEAFFPEKGCSTAPAKRVCQGCPARLPCLLYALENDERYGVYGGLSERERRSLKRTGWTAADPLPVGRTPRTKSGVCPHCGKSYALLAEHVARMHSRVTAERGAA